MPWNRGLHQVQIIRFKKKCIWMSTITAAAVFALSTLNPQGPTLDTQQNGWNTAEIIWQLRLFVFKFPAYQDRMTWFFINFVFKSVEIRFVCKNHAFQSSLLFHLRTFLSTGNFFKIEVLEYSLIVTCTLLVSETVCVGIMLQLTAGWKHSLAEFS